MQVDVCLQSTIAVFHDVRVCEYKAKGFAIWRTHLGLLAASRSTVV